MNGLIYKITNNLSGKSYIGQTTKTLEERFNQHIKDSKYSHTERRPLYEAFNKYGIENFSIELIEECEISILNAKEIYWIGYYHTYTSGYNATYGGDGNCLYDYKKIEDMLINNFSTKEICETIQCDRRVVYQVAKKINFPMTNRNKNWQKSVEQYDMELNLLRVFDSVKNAQRWCIENKYTTCENASNISSVCKGNRKSAFGFIWKYRKDTLVT